MRKFRVGDRVQVKYGRSSCSHLCQEKIRKIIRIEKTFCMLECKHAGAWNEELILMELKNEIDYLDAFQNNFKEGV